MSGFLGPVERFGVWANRKSVRGGSDRPKKEKRRRVSNRFKTFFLVIFTFISLAIGPPPCVDYGMDERNNAQTPNGHNHNIYEIHKRALRVPFAFIIA